MIAEKGEVFLSCLLHSRLHATTVTIAERLHNCCLIARCGSKQASLHQPAVSRTVFAESKYEFSALSNAC